MIAAMAIMTVQAVFPYFTLIPRDIISNTFHVVTSEPGGPDKDAVATEMATRLDAFYTAVFAVAGSAANYVVWGGGTVRVFDLSEPSPRVPATSPLVVSVAAVNSSPIPPEAAVVMSYHSALVSGVTHQRLYNRIYIGGLGSNAITASSASLFPVVNAAFRTAIAGAAVALEGANTADIAWIQYSQADATPRPIVGGFINNEIDTQRRRGVTESARTTWSV